MKIQKQDLVQKLEKVKPGLSPNDLIEGANSFLFTGKEIITFNDEICNRVEYKSEFKGTVLADPFFKIINKMKTDLIDITEQAGELLIKSKKTKVGIILNKEGALPIDELGEFPKDKDFKQLPDNFIQGLSLSSFCASTDQSTPILNCVFVKDNEIQSTDSFRVFSFDLNSKSSKSSKDKMPPFLIPVNNISTLEKYNIKYYSLRPAWIHFKTKEEENISIRTYPPDEFPDINAIFDVKGERYIFPDKIQEILDKAIIFCDKDFDIDNHVTVQIKGKKLTVSSKSDYGWFKESTIIKDAGNNIQFDTNPTFFKQILKKGTECIISKESDKGAKVLFKGQNWKYVSAISILSILKEE